MSHAPPTTLIITTYNWDAALDLVLRSVLAQSRVPDEVVIADDGSGPTTAALVADFGRRFPVPLRHVWHEDRGFRLTAIRNRALAAARGPYVIMLDGDMVLHPEFIASHAAFARRGSYVQAGRVLLRETATRRLFQSRTVRVGPFSRGIGNRINALHLPLLSRLYRGPRGPLRRTRGGNMGYWLEDAQRINGYNEDCVGWGAEDVEFAARLQNAGVTRRNLKFGGIAFHLHHTTRPPGSEPANLELYERALREKLAWCENGFDKYATTATTASPGAVHG
jgi:glycosyltransferase involved in cell wall biosynthesis